MKVIITKPIVLKYYNFYKTIKCEKNDIFSISEIIYVHISI